MKKILFLCDGDHFSDGAFNFIKFLNETEPVFVKGVFFAPIDFQELKNLSYIPIAKPYNDLEDREKKLVAQSKEKFIAACNAGKLSYSITEDLAWDKSRIIKETLFADLLVLSEELFCSDIISYQPNVYMKELLHSAECPAILVPEGYKNPERIVVAYDGKKESMLAVKQFCYLFPQLAKLSTEFVYIKKEKGNEIPDQDLLMEYAKCHFNNSAVTKLHFDAKEYFTKWATDNKNILLITGSYGRSAISDMVHHSFAEQIIHEHKLPLFIAHHY